MSEGGEGKQEQEESITVGNWGSILRGPSKEPCRAHLRGTGKLEHLSTASQNLSVRVALGDRKPLTLGGGAAEPALKRGRKPSLRGW